jgi:hypothetical protein
MHYLPMYLFVESSSPLPLLYSSVRFSLALTDEDHDPHALRDAEVPPGHARDHDAHHGGDDPADRDDREERDHQVAGHQVQNLRGDRIKETVGLREALQACMNMALSLYKYSPNKDEARTTKASPKTMPRPEMALEVRFSLVIRLIHTSPMVGYAPRSPGGAAAF